MMRPNRRFVPTLSSLECRNLLSTVPMNFVGPLDQNTVRTDYNPNPPGNPVVSITSSSSNSIGGGIKLDVTPAGNYLFTQVKYKMSGAIASQQWLVDSANYVPIVGDVVHSWPTPKGSDWLQFYWNENPGARTVTVEVTYNDTANTVKTWTQNFNVTAPDVKSFYAYSRGTTFANSGDSIGFAQEDKTYFGGEFNSIPTNGMVGVIQMVNEQNICQGTHQNTTTSFPSDKTFLDWAQGHTPYMCNYSEMITPNPGNVIPMGGYNKVYDLPAYSVTKPTVDSTNVYTSINYHYHFDTYLDWIPTGGIHVEVAHLVWDVAGQAVYNGSTDQPAVLTDYGNIANWTVNVTHLPDPTPWRVDGDKNRMIPTWDMNSVTGYVKYTTTTNF